LLRNQTLDGDRLEGVPDWSTSLFAQYTRPLNSTWFGGHVDAIVNGDWSYRSSKTTGFRPAAGNFRTLDDYHHVNLRAGLVSDKWDVWLRINNVFDVLPEISGRIVDNDPFKFATLQPRTIGVSFGYHY
jgi:outer membrane receptor protein involved in Fe transport